MADGLVATHHQKAQQIHELADDADIFFLQELGPWDQSVKKGRST